MTNSQSAEPEGPADVSSEEEAIRLIASRIQISDEGAEDGRENDPGPPRQQFRLRTLLFTVAACALLSAVITWAVEWRLWYLGLPDEEKFGVDYTLPICGCYCGLPALFLVSVVWFVIALRRPPEP